MCRLCYDEYETGKVRGGYALESRMSGACMESDCIGGFCYFL